MNILSVNIEGGKIAVLQETACLVSLHSIILPEWIHASLYRETDLNRWQRTFPSCTSGSASSLNNLFAQVVLSTVARTLGNG